MLQGGDMIANLYRLPQEEFPDSFKIKRAFVGDKEKILEFIGTHFQKSWVYEAEHALMDTISKCFIATKNGEVIGFACFDATARGYFGPIGVHPDYRHEKIGKALLLRTLHSMREYGYGYAVIGWVGDAEPFYRKIVGAEFIPGGDPEHTVYSNLVFL